MDETIEIRYTIFHRKPWFVLGWCIAENKNGMTPYEDAMRQAVEKYYFLEREQLQVAPSMYQGNMKG